MKDERQVICLTPVKNEAWILDRFLQCASLWADRIVIADQRSSDGSREIAQRYSRVHLIDNPVPGLDENVRQRLLLQAAREIAPACTRVLVALDADEALTGNVVEGEEWRRALRAAPGTVLQFQWLNILPGLQTCWIPPHLIPFGFVDDGSEHHGAIIHNNRLPYPDNAPVLRLRDIGVLHYQYTAWERMQNKQRWYQCWERVNHPRKRAITIYRQYHHMVARRPEEVHSMRPEWTSAYERMGADMARVASDPGAHWQADILAWLTQYGARHFRKLDIWDVDWQAAARRAGVGEPAGFADPRSPWEQRIHRWLGATQAQCQNPRVRLIQRLLRIGGW